MNAALIDARRVALAGLALLVLAAAATGAHARPKPARDAAAAAVDGQTPLQQRTAAALSSWLRGTRIAPSDVGLVAVPLDGGPPLVSLDAGQPFNPASTIKLLTTVAALSLLGPDYRWRTGAWLRGRLDDGVLAGDLVLRGGGDPKLVVEDLAEFVTRMRAAGLREIRGDLVIDDALFDVGRESVERFDLDPSQPYNVRPHALLANFKSARLVARPAGDGVALSVDPPLADLVIDADVQPRRGPCGAGASGLTVRDDGDADPPRIRAWGSYPIACGEQGVFVSMLSHRQFIHGLFKSVWRAAGGTWDGRTRVERGAAQGAPWLEWVSPRTLADVVRDINKFSNNVMARQVFLMLSPDLGHRPATVERARAALRAWLAAQQLDFPGLYVDNGAGLSRDVRISAASLVQLLRFAAAGPYAELLRGSLPEVGVDGTMRRRMIGEPIAGRAWIKTGSLSGVRAIAGYVDAASGRRYAVALLVNGPRAEGAQPLQDRFLRWVHENG